MIVYELQWTVPVVINHRYFSNDKFKVFKNKDRAIEFKESLEAALKLLEAKPDVTNIKIIEITVDDN